MKILFLLAYCINIFLIQNIFEKSIFYNVISGSDIKAINHTIFILEKEPRSSINNAYLGALLIKKSLFVQKSKEKIASFNKGKLLLEKEVVKNPDNIEIRFIRLIIQENTPKFLKYNYNIEEDKNLIIYNYNKMSNDLKVIIKDFSKNSKILRPEYF